MDVQCAPHVFNPAPVLKNAARSRRSVRVFDWLYAAPCDGHLHTITEEMVAAPFPAEEWRRAQGEVGAIQARAHNRRLLPLRRLVT